MLNKTGLERSIICVILFSYYKQNILLNRSSEDLKKWNIQNVHMILSRLYVKFTFQMKGGNVFTSVRKHEAKNCLACIRFSFVTTIKDILWWKSFDIIHLKFAYQGKDRYLFTLATGLTSLSLIEYLIEVNPNFVSLLNYKTWFIIHHYIIPISCYNVIGKY